jgi:hypothetical protein
MGAQRRSRIVELMVHATLAVVILATALLPLISPGIEAKGNTRHGHSQHQATERANGTGTGSQHPQVASAGTKRHTNKKKKGGHRSGHGHPGTIFNPPSPTAPSRFTTTETFTLSSQPTCIPHPDPPSALCSDWMWYHLNGPTPVQIEVIPHLPCGTGTVWIVPLDNDMYPSSQVLASRQDIPSGSSSGVIDLGTVGSIVIAWGLSNYEGCGPIPRTGSPFTMSATVMVTTPTPGSVLTP